MEEVDAKGVKEWSLIYTMLILISVTRAREGQRGRDASGLAREPTYKLNFRGLLRQPT